MRLSSHKPTARLAAAAAAAILAGCGSTGPAAKSSTAAQSRVPGTSHASPAPDAGQSPQGIPTPGPTGIRADPGAVNVIKAWSDALRRGDVSGAARYFAVPSLMINGPDANGQVVAISIRSRAEAEAANASLPCGARLISTDQRGQYVNALFRLTNRPGPGGGCDSGIGQTARTNFVIRHLRIVEWIRAPADPGDNGSPPQTAPGPPSGGATSGPSV